MAARTSLASSLPSPFWSCGEFGRPQDRRVWDYAGRRRLRARPRGSGAGRRKHERGGPPRSVPPPPRTRKRLCLRAKAQMFSQLTTMNWFISSHCGRGGAWRGVIGRPPGGDS